MAATPLGHLELTLPRVMPSLSEVHCGTDKGADWGGGHSAETMAFGLLRRAQRLAAETHRTRLTIEADRATLLALAGPAKAYLTWLETARALSLDLRELKAVPNEGVVYVNE